MSQRSSLLIIAILHFLDILRLTCSESVEIPKECKEYCEQRRPRYVLDDEPFVVECNSMKGRYDTVMCERMCEGGKCPASSICRKGGFQVHCPPKQDTHTEALAEDFFTLEMGFFYGGCVIGLVMVIVLIALCILDQIRYKRELEEVRRQEAWLEMAEEQILQKRRQEEESRHLNYSDEDEESPPPPPSSSNKRSPKKTPKRPVKSFLYEDETY